MMSPTMSKEDAAAKQNIYAKTAFLMYGAAQKRIQKTRAKWDDNVGVLKSFSETAVERTVTSQTKDVRVPTLRQGTRKNDLDAIYRRALHRG